MLCEWSQSFHCPQHNFNVQIFQISGNPITKLHLTLSGCRVELSPHCSRLTSKYSLERRATADKLADAYGNIVSFLYDSTASKLYMP